MTTATFLLHQASRLLVRSIVLAFLAVGFSAFQSSVLASKAYIDSDQVLVIDSKKVFPIGFTMPPPVDGKAPNGRNATAELADAGATFLRTGPMGHDWDNESIREAKKCLDAAAKYKMYVWFNLRENSSIEDKHPEREAMLRKLVTTFKDHRGMGVWKGADEPAWGKHPIPPLKRAYDIVHEIDPHHPMVTIHAPRDTLELRRSYNVVTDIVGTDIYPIGYPPGTHSGTTNRELSAVGDYTKEMVELAEGKRSVWMTLQVLWSGVSNRGKTLRFPTFPEQRFMVYDAIINGARGVMFFGGSGSTGWNEQDTKLGWNWHFWNQVLRRVVEEIGTKSPLYPALLEPDSKMPVKVGVLANPNAKDSPTKETAEIEFCVREVGDDIFVIAAKKTKESTVKVEFSGLPATATGGDMLFEEPRKVELKDGKFTDWFAPFEVHVYRFKKQ